MFGEQLRLGKTEDWDAASRSQGEGKRLPGPEQLSEGRLFPEAELFLKAELTVKAELSPEAKVPQI